MDYAFDSTDLKSARERLGESQAEFAERFGVSQASIHRWETEGVPDRGSARAIVNQVLPKIVRRLERAAEQAA